MTASPVTMKSKRTTKPTIRVLRKKRKTAKKQQTKKTLQTDKRRQDTNPFTGLPNMHSGEKN